MDKRPIGIFDSGLGGLTCVRRVLEIMPNEDIIYFGDTARVPYGTKSAEQIIKYARQDINFLKTFDIKYIIIACGTASSAALPGIVGEYDTLMTGVLKPASFAAASVTKNKKVGVIGTSGTIRSGKYKEELMKISPDLKVFQKACPMFVPLVENGYASSDAARLIAKDYLTELKNEGIDTLILGCTHYPLLKEVIKEVLGDKVSLIDAGEVAAEFAKEELKIKGLLNKSEEKGKIRYFVSDITEGFSHLGGMFLNREITDDVERINIEEF